MANAGEQQDMSMEEILASIRKIISEDGDEETPDGELAEPTLASDEETVEALASEEPTIANDDLAQDAVDENDSVDPDSGGPLPQSSDAAPDIQNHTVEDERADNVVDFQSEIDRADAPAEPEVSFVSDATAAAVQDDVLELTEIVGANDSLLSPQSAVAAKQRFSELSGLLVRGYEGSENTLEGVVREMLRPMLKEWLDDNLPELVERMVQKEISRITNREL